jgi:hypothetical protein
MHEWLYHSWGGAPPEIVEWAAPRPGNPAFWPFVTIFVVSAASLAATQRKRDWTQIVVYTLVVWQASMHLRHIAFVALLCGAWLPIHWHSAIMRLRPDRDKRLPIVLPPLWLRLSMAAAIIVGVVAQSVLVANRLTDFPVVRSKYPVDAFQFMVDNRIGGKMVCAFNWAQYALAALSPEVTLGFDGRFDTCYPQEAIDIHFDFQLGDSGPRERRPDAGPIDRTKALEYHSPDLVLIDRDYKTWAEVMETEGAKENPAWVRLYSDPVAELWGRASRYDDPKSPQYFPTEHRKLNVRLLEAEFQWPALPDRSLWEEHEEASAKQSVPPAEGTLAANPN